MIFAIVLYLGGVALIVLVLHAALARPNELLEPLVPSQTRGSQEHEESKERRVAAREPQREPERNHPEMVLH